MINKSIFNNVKPIFSGHETFPLRYGWLKKVYDATKDAEKKQLSISKDIFGNDESISTFGVGKNMVASMKYWATYSGLFDISTDKSLKINPLFRNIFKESGLDPWIENPSTLWLIHWKLSTNPYLITYYWFYNGLNITSFDKDVLVNSIVDLLKEIKQDAISKSTIKRDVECFIHIYASKPPKEKSNEESIDSPLTELGLISPLTKRDLFQIKRGPKTNLSFNTFMFCLLMFWKNYSPNSKTLSLEAICYEPLSPGRIFLIDENTVISFIQDISEKSKGIIEWTETAGLKQALLKIEIDFEKEAYRFFERNYK